MIRLSELAIKHGTDKWGHHFYCDIYQSYFDKLRDQPISIMEMGFGGYEFPDKGGGSVKMWAEYFTDPAAKIVVTDIYEKSLQGFDTRIKFLQLPMHQQQISAYGPYDIIVDDASHNSQEIIKDFRQYFPLIKPGGIYVVEDCQTSYWDIEQYGGTPDLRGEPESSTMNFFKHLADSINRAYLAGNQFEEFKEIFSIHFYEKMIFILKK